MSNYDYFNEEELDTRKLRYALYARKSTDDPKRQSRSIEDQIAECERMAAAWGIKLVKPYIREEKSAKTPNNRKEFKQLLSDLEKGKYDGIVSWHPDRLARNMKEGGEIIDLVDNNVIRDLKFCTHHFTNDASGKMLLGMAFVLSKEYSDRLSANVKRGVKRSFLEGRSSGSYKPGYVIDKEGRYVKDAHSFEIVQKAWLDRLKGLSFDDISDRMNKRGFKRVYKNDPSKSSPMTPQKLTKLFKDPIYYGFLAQNGSMIDLREKYDFETMVSEHEFQDVQTYNRSKLPNTIKRRHTFYPLKRMVICSYCQRYMYPGASKGSTGKKWLYYNCQNKLCARPKKSIRAKVIFDWAYDILANGLNFNESDYDAVKERLSKVSESKKNVLVQEVNSLESVVRNHETKMRSIALNLAKLEIGSKARQINEKELNDIDEEAERLKIKIEGLRNTLDNSKGIEITLASFLNLSKNAASKVEAGNSVQKDNILRSIFLNLTVNEKEVVSYLCKEPFTTLLNDRSILNGRGERT